MTRETVGVVGGTFDPVHCGHLRIAEETRRAFGVARVLLVPCAQPPHKAPGTVTAAQHRLAMLHIAVAGREHEIAVSTLEIERGGTSFTIDTLRALRGEHGLEPLFVLGLDALLEIETWRDYEQLLREFDLVLVERGGDTGAGSRVLDHTLRRRLAPFAAGSSLGSGGRIYRLPIEPIAVSSREIRERVRAGLPLDGLVPPGVARYIQEEKLYTTGG